jgi:bifunctional UDP-N-acetylglucosamine pyrophosphorylase / glucosamine-1-phosphate N-acetyltransferase
MSDPKITAVILAAGKGTRMKSTRPKVLFPAVGKPLLSHVIDAVDAAGVSDVVAVLGHGRDEVSAMLRARYGERVRTAIQEEQRGTGHAVMVALPAVQTSSRAVLVVCGDTPRLEPGALAALIERFGTSGAPAAMWVTTLLDPTGYGRVILDDEGRVARIVEQKDASPTERAVRRINPGVYVFDRAFLHTTLPSLRADNAAGELYLTDVIAAAAAAGGVAALEVDAEMTMGINDRQQLHEAELALRDRRRRALRLQGVTIDDSAVVEADVTVGVDVEIAAGVQLRGKTTVGDGARIGVGCVVTDCAIAAGVTLHPYSVCDQARVATGAIVGPFARLRPDADVGEDAHVGNFVELKKTSLGRGSKANHLSYLGDAVIGSGVNIGAGTITCNYDGIGKHTTVIEDGAFTGSHSTLVAPIVLGKDSYIAAGSVVTSAVPRDAVAFGRARQENKLGHAAALREKNAARAGKKKAPSGG